MGYIFFSLVCFVVLVAAAVLFTKRNDVDPEKLRDFELRLQGMDTKIEDSRDKAMYALGRSDAAYSTVKEVETKSHIIEGIVQHIATQKTMVDVNVHYVNRKPLLPPAPKPPKEQKPTGRRQGRPTDANDGRSPSTPTRMMDRAKHGDSSQLPIGFGGVSPA